MIITVASGKGGTGKTTFSVNLAYSLAGAATPVQLLDCDVEEPNVNLFFNAPVEAEEYVTQFKPAPVQDKCTGCRACVQACRFNALAIAGTRVMVFDDLCHGCGVCATVCPSGAIEEREVRVGTVDTHRWAGMEIVTGTVEIGHAASPAVISAVKEHIENSRTTIIDAPPGTTCSVVAAAENTDAVILVTEATPFGIHDLALAAALTRKLTIPAAIVVNQSDGRDTLVAEFASRAGLPIIGRIPYNRDYAAAYSRGLILAEVFPEYRTLMLEIVDSMDFRIAGECPSAFALRNKPRTGSLQKSRNEARRSHTGNEPQANDGTSRRARPAEVVVISGKGGAGKTSLTAAFAQLGSDMVIADTDVDAADLHLLLNPTVLEAHAFFGGVMAQVDPQKCTGCGLCADACRFDAISPSGQGNKTTEITFSVNPLLCEGCGMCSVVCPAQAISDQEHETGEWYLSTTDLGPMAHASLGIAEENSGRLVSKVRTNARTYTPSAIILTDGPPGVGCPVTASITGARIAVIVTEPTVSGYHDLERVLKLTHHFGVKSVVVINKADINPGKVQAIEELAAARDAPVAGRIPFDRQVTEALRLGRTMLSLEGTGTAQAVRDAWSRITTILKSL